MMNGGTIYMLPMLVISLIAGCSAPADDFTAAVKEYEGLVISEIAANEDKENAVTWVELYNSTENDIDISGLGLYVSDEYFDGKELSSFEGMTVNAGKRMVVSTADGSLVTGISSASDFTVTLGLSADKGIVDSFHRDTDAASQPTSRYGSYQRIPEIAGEWVTTPQATEKRRNSDSRPNAIWVWSSHLDRWIADDFAVLREMKSLGYDHVLLNYNAFEQASKIQMTHDLIAAAEEIGVTVHAWIQCFYDGSWVNPIEKIDENTGRYKQELFDAIIAKANRYLDEFGVEGIHLDYIRFSGVKANAAYNNNYDNGVTAQGAVTEFCRQLRESMDERDIKVILSAACMAEDNAARYYGQNPALMGRYIDILMPMIYRYNESGAYSEDWCKRMSRLFTANTDAQVWAGITTYDYEGTSVSGLAKEEIRSDAEIFRDTECTGLVLFRYGLGDFPDVNDLWK